MVEQESVSLVTTSLTAVPVAPELGLVLEGGIITTTHVETKHGKGLIMVRRASRPWGTSWCSNYSAGNLTVHLYELQFAHIVSKTLLNSILFLLGKSSKRYRFKRLITHNLNFNCIGRKTH